MRRPWPMRFVLNLIKLAAVLSRGQEGRCLLHPDVQHLAVPGEDTQILLFTNV
jgi:hypothetical protein